MKPTDTILVVDDDANDQLFIARAFHRIGVPNPIQVLNSGNEAIHYLNGEGQYADRKAFPYPTFTLTDLKMADGDGFKLLRDLKSHPQWAVIPTIMLNGTDRPDDVKKAYQLGANAFFVKPTDLSELEKLARVIYDFWTMCKVPEVDVDGQQLPTTTHGGGGASYPQLAHQDKKRGA